MDRAYTTGNSDSVTFFVGSEVEHTPAYGMRTLFVVGLQSVEEILEYASNSKCTHIYFGANQSFNTNGVNDADTWIPWENMIKACLNAGFWCTLDLDVKDVEGLAESGLSEHRRFIPQISVKIPYLQLLNYNATIKIDDKDFAASNPGIWCIDLHSMLDRKYFNDWDDYTKDEIIK